MQYLYKIKPSVEQPKSRPGPGMCGRVSCSYQTAIWWCNDVSENRNIAPSARFKADFV
jgi:hypothetical protein